MIKAEPLFRSYYPQEVEAVLFAESGSPAGTTKIAGVTLQERALRILLRSKFARVTAVSSQPPRRWEKQAREGDIQIRRQWSPGRRPVLLLNAEMAFERSFPEKVVGQLSTSPVTLFLGPGGEPVAIFCEAGSVALDNLATFQEAAAKLRDEGAEERSVEEDWICHRVATSQEARQFHRRIERTLIKSTDHMFARWNRHLSLPLSRVLAELPITPNQVTFATLGVAIVGAYFFSRGGYWEMLLGAVLTQVSSILDGNDGELARLKIEDSDFGTWLDTVCDYVAYFLTFGGIGWGLYSRNHDPYYLILTGVFFLGIGITMSLLSYFRKSHTGQGEAGSLKSKAVQMLAREEKRDLWSYVSARLNHFATRATFSWHLILFGILNWWPALLYFAVVGAHAYWISILYHARHLRQA